jgi:hypothetical protein
VRSKSSNCVLYDSLNRRRSMMMHDEQGRSEKMRVMNERDDDVLFCDDVERPFVDDGYK